MIQMDEYIINRFFSKKVCVYRFPKCFEERKYTSDMIQGKMSCDRYVCYRIYTTVDDIASKAIIKLIINIKQQTVRIRQI